MGFANSPVSSAVFTIIPVAATPVITPNGGSYTGSVSVSLSTTTSGASIYCTTDGSAPTTGSASYTAPFTLTASATVKAIAVRSGYTNSAVASAAFTVTPAAGFTPIRVNAGGPAYTDPQGQVWSADTGFSGGSAYSTGTAIAGTNTPVLYQSERWGAMQYQFAVPNGTYTVKLKFAEIYFSNSGQRVFNVLLNGQPVLANFDIVAAAGGAFKAIDRPFTVNVTNGAIAIQFTQVVDNPKISAVEIVGN